MDNQVLLQLKDERAERNIEQKMAKPLVMVVENDQDTLLLISVLLRNIGYNVIDASNGEKALELLQANNPEIIFMDVYMPVMDGFTATRRIRELAEPYRFVTIIGLVAGAVQEDFEKCRAAGMNDYISKPFRLEEIMGKLKLPPAA